jgi:elongation factor 4
MAPTTTTTTASTMASPPPVPGRLGPEDIDRIPPERIRNFSIIAHIDHGKSTLADRLLEVTGTIPPSAGNKQVLDKLKVERDRGITVRAQCASMIYQHPGDGATYLLNLIDTPGHVDFHQEVYRSLSACQGVLLLVDAINGVQAQTVANFYLAFSANLHILPVINKVDLPTANVERVREQIRSAFELEDPVCISAKTGLNVEALLPELIKQLPGPAGSVAAPFKAFLFDAWYDKYMGRGGGGCVGAGCFERSLFRAGSR